MGLSDWWITVRVCVVTGLFTEFGSSYRTGRGSFMIISELNCALIRFVLAPCFNFESFFKGNFAFHWKVPFNAVPPLTNEKQSDTDLDLVFLNFCGSKVARINQTATVGDALVAASFVFISLIFHLQSTRQRRPLFGPRVGGGRLAPRN